MTRSQTIPETIAGQVQSRPERAFLRFRDLGGGADERYTYGELWRAGSAFASSLAGIPHEALVLIVMPLGKRLLAAHLGVQMCAAIPSIFTHPSEKIPATVYERNLAHALSLLRPGAVVVSREFAGVVGNAMQGANAVVVIADDIPEFVDEETRAWHALHPQHTAIVQHSSGSTGLQKGVALSHAMVTGQCAAYARRIALDADADHICSWLPLYHDMGLFTAWLMPVLHGASVSMMDPFQWVKQPVALLQLIDEVGGTLCWQPNFAFSMLAQRAAGAIGLDLSSMRGFINCSEPVTAAAMRSFVDAFGGCGVTGQQLWTCYAMAENAFAVTSAGDGRGEVRMIDVDGAAFSAGKIRPPVTDARMQLMSCGVPIDEVDLKIVGVGRQAQPEREIGEIAVRSPYTMREYFRNPAATASSTDAQGWYYTGDLGFLSDGELYVTGRQKDLIIIGGRNFYPQDIERIADESPNAIPGRSVAFGIDDPLLGTQKAAVLVESRLLEADARANLAAAIRQAAFLQLDCPIANVQVVPPLSLLKTSSGKISRNANRERYLAELTQPVVEGYAIAEKRALPPHRASLVEMVGWSFTIALFGYLYMLIFVLGESESWNVYAGF